MISLNKEKVDIPGYIKSMKNNRTRKKSSGQVRYLICGQKLFYFIILGSARPTGGIYFICNLGY